MFQLIAKKIFGSVNDRMIKSLLPEVEKINALESKISALSDDELKAKTAEFKKNLADGASLDSLLYEAFAVVREASKRALNMRHFDVHLVGGMVLHQGKISEMKTGEGKTLVATLPCYLNALSGKGVHVVTVNDYLARRDAEWMGKIHEFFGLTVGCLTNDLNDEERKAAYECDITYATNNELGFDYLRDNMKFSREHMVQRSHHFAIVDEVDSILIDEARTPLIISGPTNDNSKLYEEINRLIPRLAATDFQLGEKDRGVFLTEAGIKTVKKILKNSGLIESNSSLYDPTHISLVHHVNCALKAHKIFKNEIDYIVKDCAVVIIDEFTGRMQEGRRFSDGLHQALEAKEGVKVRNENQTLASITFQNYFRLYKKLAGMTGTAQTEAVEFEEIYGLKVAEIPTNRPITRKDEDDEIYKNDQGKYEAIIKSIKEAHEKNQPILVGTVSIEKSEYLSKLLRAHKLPHQVLNAKYHEKEAEIIAQAGKPGAITIATNMAGRGTDIKLGGADENEKEKKIVIEAGGLYVLGTERHESRRIDNQLRGRSGRQGDPGKSKFFLSLHDNLLRIFGGERLNSIMQRIGMEKGAALESRMLSRSIENAQRKVEAHNFDIRKQLLEYDDVANEQRKVIYSQRDELLTADSILETIESIRHQVVDIALNNFIPPLSLEEQWDVPGLERQLEQDFNLRLPVREWLDKDDNLHEENLRARIHAEFKKIYENKEQQVTPAVLRQFEKAVMLQT